MFFYIFNTLKINQTFNDLTHRLSNNINYIQQYKVCSLKADIANQYKMSQQVSQFSGFTEEKQ